MSLPSSSLLTPADDTEASISISFAICLKMNSAIADLHMFPWHTNMMFTALTVSEKEEANNTGSLSLRVIDQPHCTAQVSQSWHTDVISCASALYQSFDQ